MEQVNVSYNTAQGTLRGMHYQTAPFQEIKTVRCVRGAAFDVVVDLRRTPPRCQWFAVELTAENRRALYVPEGVAHGFQTLTGDTEVIYTVSAPTRLRMPRVSDGTIPCSASTGRKPRTERFIRAIARIPILCLSSTARAS